MDQSRNSLKSCFAKDLNKLEGVTGTEKSVLDIPKTETPEVAT